MKYLFIVICAVLVLVFAGTEAFFQPSCSSCRHHRSQPLSMRFGGHGQGFNFLPLYRSDRDEHYPRIVKIAGVYPQLTIDDFFAPVSSPAAPKGSWAYDFPDPSGPELGSVALPGSDVITKCIDPVVLITTNTELGVSLNEEVEMLVVVDRGERELFSDAFYVFKTPDETLSIQWCDSPEPDEGYEILGRVIVVNCPYHESMHPQRTGFLEEDEE